MGDTLSEADRALHTQLADDLARMRRSSPLEILGLSAGADEAEIRAAFLALTKRNHPNRFARRDPSILRLANEVFLLVRAAYEKASAPRAPGESSGSAVLRASSIRQSDTIRLPAVPRPPTTSSAPPAPSTPQSQPRTNPPSAARTAAPSSPPAVTRAAGPSSPPAVTQPAPVSRSQQLAQPPADRTQPMSQTIDDELRAAIAEKRRQRLQNTPAIGSLPSAPPGASARASTQTPIIEEKPSGTWAAAVPRPSREERVRMARRQLETGQLAAARAAFRTLLAEKAEPQVKGLLHLAAGRELIADGKLADGRAELERAMAADPDLAEAREALAAIDKKDGGLFSRWFRK